MTRPRHLWSAEDDATLARLYPTHSAAEIAALIGASVKAVWSRAAGLGLKKPAAWIAETARRNSLKEGHGGRATQFRKGQTPWNAGREFDPGGRSHDTRFKPGHRGGNALELWQPVGTTRINKDGYTERKINDVFPMHRRWRAEHLVIWEAANGPLPKGHAVAFKDGDKTHLDLDNLELITRADLLRRNSSQRWGKEVFSLIQLKGAITRQLNKPPEAA